MTLADFKPSVVQAFNAAKQQEGPSRLELEVVVPASDAEISVDGASQGQSPWKGTVAEGVHLVTATAHGRRPFASLVEVTKHRRLELELTADPERQAIHRGRSSLQVSTSAATASIAASALMQFAELDALLFATSVWRRGAPALIAEWCVGVPVRCHRTVELRYRSSRDLETAARELWARARQEQGRLEPGLLLDARVVNPDPAPGPKGPVKKRHWAKNPAVWAGTAVGVAALVAATVLWTREDERRPEVVIGSELFP